MKSPRPNVRSASGFVLILVLGSLAVITLLLFALLGGSTHQARVAENEATLAREKILADSAVAIVMGQIAKASTQPGQTWISQPGLLRTYGPSAKRMPMASYKLYSAPQMMDQSGSLAFLTTDSPTDWNSSANQSVYTDLNTPQKPPGFLPPTIYPIFDPKAQGTVEGVSIDPGRGAEMPVAWLYQLQDGTLGPAASGTTANPIVARVAFWTDDETCKINVNTAGCGSPWETPRVHSSDDVTWSQTIPAGGEYARYPGHPASTSLAVVLGNPTKWTADAVLALTPRYGNGGSDFGAVTTSPGQIVPPKLDRLYASVDALCFDPTSTSLGQSQLSSISAAQVEMSRFVLTAHSEAPETTMLGEPRVAIWPVSGAMNDSTRTTAADRAVRSAATVGGRAYLFQRQNALSATDDLDPIVSPDNAKLFATLLARGDTPLPGYGAALTSKYTGATWAQLLVEIADYIRGINAVDPSPSPFVSYAGGNSKSGQGVGFIVPITTKHAPEGTLLRGFGRCPTLSSLTLVFYVCGFAFDDGSQVDYTASGDPGGAKWALFFPPYSTRWAHVTGELVRAFVVPSTFQPGCSFPEVSEDCLVEIDGLNGIKMATGNDFGFTATSLSRSLADAQTVLTAERAWGGNEGPLAWRAASLDATADGNGSPYPFAGGKPFLVSFAATGSPKVDPKTGKVTWPSPSFSFPDTNVTVKIRNATGTPWQTLALDLPAFSCPAPTPLNACDHRDGSTPGNASVLWATLATNKVQPSYYMNLNNRLLATQNSRPFLIQPGDVVRSVEAATDLRVIAALPAVSSTFFKPHPANIKNITMAHNLRFADGTSAYGADGSTALVGSVLYPANVAGIPITNWADGTTTIFTWSTSPSRSVPIGTSSVTMMPLLNGTTAQKINGDWDTGLGDAPDGPLLNLPDAGTSLDPATAYFSLGSGQPGATPQRTPNALVSSPVLFGSLPAGIDPLHPEQSQPWRTLAFCPFPAGDTAHPGLANPPDHLVLDHFWMPVIEPYAISSCMATAGKINLNDQIVPFAYLHRSTALRAVLHDLRIPAIPASGGSTYKTPGQSITSIWRQLDVDATLAGMESRYDSPDAYLSESEICTVPLVPKNVTLAALDSFWNGNTGGGRLTGDNLRELPYAQIYSRLTTRSNSYTVHVRAQILQKRAGDPQQNVWKENQDQVLGDWRGSYEIERYLDANAPAPADGKQLGPYHFRIVSSRRFTP